MDCFTFRCWCAYPLLCFAAALLCLFEKQFERMLDIIAESGHTHIVKYLLSNGGVWSLGTLCQPNKKVLVCMAKTSDLDKVDNLGYVSCDIPARMVHGN